ncbi:MAG: hypothetical protein C5B51_15175 [Terriglobia bacterium]|nr:MAG: hypothetical protein C5B51_15175 [Terriglobia bacterium]
MPPTSPLDAAEWRGPKNSDSNPATVKPGFVGQRFQMIPSLTLPDNTIVGAVAGVGGAIIIIENGS